MSPFRQALKLTWEHVAAGDQDIGLPDFGHPPADEHLNSFLVDMYQGHGADVLCAGDWVLVDGGAMITRGACVGRRQHPSMFMVQVDFATVVDLDKHIVESFVGVGPDEESALNDACKGFMEASFHPLFSTLLGRSCSHCDVGSWTMAGIPRVVSMGALRIRGPFPDGEWPGLFAQIQAILESHELPSGLHWIRVFYSQSPSAPPTVEVLVDNEPEPQLQFGVGQLDWPPADQFYSVRLFMVIQDEEGGLTSL